MADVNVKLALRAMPSVESDGFECYWICDANGCSIGSINGPQCHETEALANKIAAALDMYEALKALIDCLGPDGYFPSAGKTKTDAARAAIAKAEAR